MNIDLYLLDRHFKVQRFVSSPMLDVLSVWTRSLGHGITLRVSDEGGVDLNTDADVVAFSVYTHMAPAAYRLGDALREKGKAVVLGGPHFQSDRTVEEAKRHCTAVVRSICFEQWRDLLEAIEVGDVRPGDDADGAIADTDGRFRFPDDLHTAYRDKRWPLVMATLGCPYSCEYCTPFMQGRYVLRDIDAVVREMAAVRGKFVGFSDATLGVNKAHFIDLMKAVAPLRKVMFAETTLSLLHHEWLLDAMAMGGVRWLAVGVESLSFDQQKHGRNRVADRTAEIQRLIRAAVARGIVVQVNFICGMDGDGPESFERIHEFYVKSKAGLIYVDVMVPFPNSALFARLEREGRIIDHDWEHYDYHHVVYRPLRMTVDQLVDGYTQLYRSVTAPMVVARKAAGALRTIGPDGLMMAAWNVMNHFDARKKEKSMHERRRWTAAHESIEAREVALQASDSSQRHGRVHERPAGTDVGDGRLGRA